MANISGWDSSSISTLFSGLNSANSRNGAGNLGIDLSSYSQIKSGSYYKLMRAYYNEGGNEATDKLVGSTKTSKDSSKVLAQIDNASKELIESASDLYKKSGSSLTKDMDEAYKKVNEFVDSYNAMVTAAGKSETSTIANAGAAMINMTSSNMNTLSRVGISVDATTHKMSIDEDKFKKADTAAVKTLFSGAGSYAYSVASKASMINHYAETEASKSNTYNGNGNFTYNYSTGELYNSNI